MQKETELLIAKLTHDMASPLSAMIMSTEMLRDLKQTDEAKQALAILEEGLEKTKGTLEFWRFLFSLSSKNLFLSSFEQEVKKFFKVHGAMTAVVMESGGGEECCRPLAQIMGLCILALNDRLSILEQSTFHVSGKGMIWEGQAKRSDFLDRFQRQNFTTPQTLPPSFVRMACAELAMDFAFREKIKCDLRFGTHFSIALRM